MTDPASYRPAPGSIPDAPGVYRWRDPAGTVIYVGKAISLRSRVNSYFQDLGVLHPRTRQMVTTASSVEWTVVRNEVEALQLEFTWIKEFDPRFNVKYRDDKSYPSLAATMNEEFPRLQVMRGPKKKGVKYFGPYAHAWAIRETLDLLLRVFPARTCSAGVFKRAAQVGRPCLYGYIGTCSAPCVGRVTPEEHRAIVEDLCDVLDGNVDKHVKLLTRRMMTAAENQEYEAAGRLRDDIGALTRVMEKNTVVLGDGADADVVAIVHDELEAAVQVFSVRKGRIRGQHGYVVDKLEPLDTAALVEQFLSTAYLGSSDPGAEVDVPREVLVPELPADPGVVSELLSLVRGSKVDLRVPQRGDKKTLMETVTANAEESFRMHKLKRASDLTARSAALAELQGYLGMDAAPLRIECIDISHLAGTDVVASLVVFEDGLAKKNDYRRYALKGTMVREGNALDDTASMAEVVTRRFVRLQAEIAPGLEDDGRAKKFSTAPNLVVVDGGPPQVAAAARALRDLGIEVNLPGGTWLCGLAKRLEEVWLPDEDEPLILPRSSEALYLLQRARDEAHRFAITYQKQKRSKSMVESLLVGVPGLGAARRKALMTHFGSLKNLREATEAEIAALPGFGPRTASAVLAALGSVAEVPAVNAMTGEVVE